MDLTLQTHYRIEAIPLIRNFVIEAARYYGANNRETNHLGAAAEEVAEHIVQMYPPNDRIEAFEIFCRTRGDRLVFVFSNMGLPINEKAIPQYELENPMDSIDGLKFFLIEKFTDDFKFLNKGADGWQTVIEKKLGAFFNVTSAGIADTDLEGQNVAREKMTISSGTSEDTYEINKLAYLTYRYTYTKKAFYFPELLQEELENERIISFVARNPQDKIIGHIGILRSKDSDDIAEVGAIMVQPEYRQSTGVLRLVRAVKNFMDKNEIGLSFLDSNLVTAHAGSQRLCGNFKFRPYALKLSVHESAEFMNIDDLSYQRESLLYSVRSYIDCLNIKLFLPENHFEIAETIFDSPYFDLELSSVEMKLDTAIKTRISIERNYSNQFAMLTLEEAGADLYKELKQRLFKLSQEKTETVFLMIPAWKVLPDKLEQKLNKSGFFFSGFIPETPQNWYVLYTCLGSQVIDFDKIKLHDDIAVELKEYIKERYLEVLP